MTQVYKYLSTLWVDGKPNEWVLIINNGKMKQAAVGLRCFKHPFDQVATFPAKIYQVPFETEQVTNEMAGVRVSAMLVWSVNRVGDGPFKAFKSFDLSSGNPVAANDQLVSMATSVVRSCIANSTIKEMITNRELLTGSIKKEMFEVVKGWGVWLETIEITGVSICSSALFKDLQTNHRQNVHQASQLFQMKIQSEIEQVKNQNDLKVQEKEREVGEHKRVYLAKIEQEKSEAREEFNLEKSGIVKEKEDLQI